MIRGRSSACLEAGIKSSFFADLISQQNIFVARPKPSWQIKIGDLGLAKQDTGSAFDTTVGTPSYTAPEISGVVERPKDKYTDACDLWSLGCVTYWLLSGEIVFPATKPRRLWDYVEDSKRLPVPPLVEKGISPEGIDFVKLLLRIQPGERPSASAAKQHGWLKNPSRT